MILSINAIPQPLYINVHFSVFLINLTVPNKHFFSVKLLLGLRGQLFDS